MWYNRTQGTEIWEGWKVQMDPYITRKLAVGKVNGVLQISLTNQSFSTTSVAGIYPNKRSAKILRDEFSEGFRLGYMWEKKSRVSHNLKSVTHLQDKVMEKMNKEIKFMTYYNSLRGGFKTQPPVNRRFRPVPGGCHCLEQ